jgi:ribosome-associated translation inhibitor RaiA
MKVPVQITFRNTPSSDSLEALIREKASHLETFYDGIVGCRVFVEIPHRHHRTGNPVHVRVDLTVPGSELVVTHEASLRGTPDEAEGAAVAIREAFDIARRQLQDFGQKQRGDVKAHEGPPRA